MEFLKTRPDMTHRALPPEQWKVLKELCSVLEPLKIVDTKIQGGVERLLSRAIYLCNDVRAMLAEDEIETIHWVSRRKLGDKAEPGPLVHTWDLTEVVKTVLSAVASEFETRKIGVPDSDVEYLALFFDPRTKGFGDNICGGAGDREKAEGALRKVKETLQETGTAAEPDAPVSASYTNPPPPKRLAVATNAYERRQRRLEGEAAASLKTASGTKRPSIQSRLSKELEEYKQLPSIPNIEDFDVLGYWHDAGRPRLDPHGNVITAAQFPILSMLARVYLSIDGTSCPSERELSNLAFVHSNLRRRTTPDRVEKMMFLRSNPDLVPKIKKLEVLLKRMSEEKYEGKTKVKRDCGGGKKNSD